MDAITYTHARSHLAETMEKVCDGDAPVIITRKNERSVVMISLEDYQALEETAYLLLSPKNDCRLLESITELEAGRGEAPDQPFSGRFTMRLSPEQHRKVILAAEKAGKDVAQWVTETLEHAIGSSGH